MCPLQIINDFEPLIINPAWCKCMLYPPTPSKKWKFLFWHKFFQRQANCKRIWNVPLDSLMCFLQIVNDIEPLTSTLHGVNACFILHPSKWKITPSVISQKPVNQRNFKKMLHWVTYFYTFVQIFGSKFKIMSAKEIRHFLKSGKLTLNSPANSPVVTYSKIQNRLSKAP